MGQQRYLAPVMITARDRAGLIRDIAAAVTETGVNMTSVSSNVGVGQELASIKATLEIDGLEQMYRVFARLEKVKGVIHVERDLGQKKK
jgi:GTP pyrophosphokinase